MKKHSSLSKKWNCRFFLKFGSGIFLLFFMLFATAAPLLAQLGSVVFLFLVMLLSPLTPESKSAAPLPNETPQVIFYQPGSEVPGNACLWRQQESLADEQIFFACTEYPIAQKIFLPDKIIGVLPPYISVLHTEYKKYSSQVRAGPAA